MGDAIMRLNTVVENTRTTHTINRDMIVKLTMIEGLFPQIIIKFLTGYTVAVCLTRICLQERSSVNRRVTQEPVDTRGYRIWRPGAWLDDVQVLKSEPQLYSYLGYSKEKYDTAVQIIQDIYNVLDRGSNPNIRIDLPDNIEVRGN